MGSEVAQPSKGAGSDYFGFLDGIRAVAVFAVVIYHADRTLLPGGYVGVDVFFVLSGFLITRICIEPDFRFTDFWAARCRRILPAYFVTLLLTSLIGALLLLPIDARSSAISIAASPSFLQNFVFWRQINYFSPTLETNPILHTWSLAVEWQFYILYPILVRLFVHRRHRLKLVILACLLGTLALSSYAAVFRPSMAFYLTPFRVWEFLIGAVLVLWPVDRVSSRWAGPIAIIGIAMIVLSALRFNSSTVFPGAAALLPCIGTGALIAAGLIDDRTTVAHVLSWPVMRAVGQASYSIYLVHWPILVFVRYWHVAPLSLGLEVAAVATSFALGFLSWRYVERPFRRPRPTAVRRRTAYSLGAMAGIGTTAGIIISTQGLPGRFSPDVLRIEASALDKGDFRQCLGFEAPNGLHQSRCRLGKREGAPKVLLWGDSHAASLAAGIDVEANRRGLAAAFIGTDSCPPLIGLEGDFKETMARCQRIQTAMPTLIQQARPSIVIIHASWRRYYERGPKRFAQQVSESFSMLHGRAEQIVIVGAVPGAGYPVAETLARMTAFGRMVDLEPSPEAFRAAQAANEVVRRAAQAQGYGFVDLLADICRPKCSATFSGTPAYFDSGHLTATAARRLVARQSSEFFPAGATRD